MRWFLLASLIGLAGCGAPSEPLRNECGMELRLGLTVRDQAYNDAVNRACFEQLARQRGQAVTECRQTPTGFVCASD